MSKSLWMCSQKSSQCLELKRLKTTEASVTKEPLSRSNIREASSVRGWFIGSKQSGKANPDCEELQTKTSSSAQRTGRRKHEQVFHPAVSCLVFHSRKKAQKLIKQQLSNCAADRCRLTSSAKTFSRLYEAENVSKSRRIQLSMNPNVRY